MITNTLHNNWESELKFDEFAHAQGRCSYSSPALCSAEEQRIKTLIEKVLQQEREKMISTVHHIANNVAWCDLENDKGEYICKGELLKELDSLNTK